VPAAADLRPGTTTTTITTIRAHQVCAMRMPADLLMVWLPQLLEGMLLWADDSKNKFRLKVGLSRGLDGVGGCLIHATTFRLACRPALGVG
jgi:hypothetical protein